MTNSKHLAGLIGPGIIILTTSEVMNYHIWATNIPPVTYLNGIILFIAGLSIVRVHNSWRGWPVAVTLAGWFGIIGGLFRVFFPEAKQASETTITYAAIAVLFGFGVFLTFKAYTRNGNKSVAR
jgi:hypothetical protein